MGIKTKITRALSEALEDAYVDLEGRDNISGFVISRQFKGMPSLKRMELIDDILRNKAASLTPEEYRRVLMIAALTDVEYQTVGNPIQVHKIKVDHGELEVLLRGNLSDAEFVRDTLEGQKAVQTSAPQPVPSAVGRLVSFRAWGSKSDPLTKDKAVRALKGNPYVKVLPGA